MTADIENIKANNIAFTPATKEIKKVYVPTINIGEGGEEPKDDITNQAVIGENFLDWAQVVKKIIRN